MNETTQFPSSADLYWKEHPEKFEERTNSKKRLLYVIIAVVLIILAIFPRIISFLLPSWMIVVGGVIGALYCLLAAFLECEKIYNIQSNGEVKKIGHKKFDRVNTNMNEIIAALANHDFDFIADAAESENDPLQIYVYEDAVGKEFYLHLRVYTAPSEFGGASDVITVSGSEYDEFRTTIRSIGPKK